MHSKGENKSMEPAEDKADQVEEEKEESKEAFPTFMTTGATSPAGRDDSWWQADRSEWEPGYRQ